MDDYRANFLLELNSAILSLTQDKDLTQKITDITTQIVNNYSLRPYVTANDSMYNSEQLIKLYCDAITVEGKSEKTVYQYLRILTRFYEDNNKTPIDKINVIQIRTWLIQLQNKVSARTAENYRSYLSAFYQWLERERIITINPMGNISPIKYCEEIRTTFSEVDIDMLRTACKTPRERAELELLLCTGIRAAELCSLNRQDIDLNNLTGFVTGKGNKQRRIYITDICRKYLELYLKTRTDDNECLFYTRNKTRITPSVVRMDMNKIGEGAGIKDVHPHRFRRTFASNNSKKGMNTKTIQRLMGHTDVNTTMGYVSLDNETLKNEYNHYN